MIYLAGEVNSQMYLDLMKKLDETIGKVEVSINSPGGGLCSGMAMYDRLKQIEDCTVTATGDCSSAALIVLQAGKFRWATPHTSFLIHLSSVVPNCDCDDCKKREPTKEDMAIKITLDLLIQKVYRYRVTEDNLKKAMNHKCFGVDKALEYGFIDGIKYGS